MKKTICGVLITVTGLCFSLAFMIYAAVNTVGLPGLFTSLRVTDTLVGFLLWVCVALGGIAICINEAFKDSLRKVRGRDKNDKAV